MYKGKVVYSRQTLIYQYFLLTFSLHNLILSEVKTVYCMHMNLTIRKDD